MESCPICEKIIYKKVITCRFCDKYFCSLTCLMDHSSVHSLTSDSLMTTLKKKQSKDESEHYSFITPGIFLDNYKYDEKYNIKNFSKVYDGFIPIELGIGSYGRVYLVTHNLTKEKYALKVINKHKLMQAYGSCELIKNEIDIHSKLHHPNIIKLYNVLETEEEINILLEYADKGNLYTLIQKEKGFNEAKACEYFIQIVNAVYFLHQNNIIHRDIKPENILISEDDTLKLCDFGWAKEIMVNNRSTFCGTVEYMAPEIVESGKYDYSVDIWSLGILLYELLMGQSPFKSKKEKNTMIKIKLHNLSFKGKKLSEECIDLINRLLDANPANRLKIKDIFEHKFIRNNAQMKKNKKNRKESLDDSSENLLKFYNKRKEDFKKDFKILRKKFGFESKMSMKDKISSKQLIEFQSEQNLFDFRKFEKNESQRLEKLIDNMSNELEKGKKKVNDLNFKKSEQFSFEDFRDGKILYDNNNTNNNHEEESKNKETQYTSNYDIEEENSF